MSSSGGRSLSCVQVCVRAVRKVQPGALVGTEPPSRCLLLILYLKVSVCVPQGFLLLSLWRCADTDLRSSLALLQQDHGPRGLGCTGVSCSHSPTPSALRPCISQYPFSAMAKLVLWLLGHLCALHLGPPHCEGTGCAWLLARFSTVLLCLCPAPCAHSRAASV